MKLDLPRLRTRRWTFFGLVLATTVAGTLMMASIVSAGGFTILEGVILSLFVPTFAWIVLPFWTAVAGFVLRITGRDPLTLRRVPREAGGAAAAGKVAPPVGLTALVVPVYDEDADAVAARVSSVARSLRGTGCADRFHIHILSDTRDQRIARVEELAWLRVQADHPDLPIHYRRRTRNEGRKAGNIREFCERAVDDYDYMVVLDADSLMTGRTLVALAAAIEADPEIGLVQTVPLPVRERTLFGRLIQFAGCLYSPMLAAGQAFWQGDSANYWGHNAIVRLRAFTESAVLPTLRGRPPMGGEILSHDFVEAALLRRDGWKVVLRSDLSGSWEEVPGTVVDFASRDRRWAQGSLQHLRLLGLPGIHGMNRLHFVLGAMGYVSSVLWLLILAAGTIYVVLPGLHGASVDMPWVAPALPVSLLLITAVLLFGPKLLGVGLAMATDRRRFGGGARLIVSALVEGLFSIVLAPVMMVYHTRFVTSILGGRSVEWNTQLRDRESLSWSVSLAAGLAPTVLGLAWGGLTFASSPAFALWLSPIFLGLLLAVPLVRWTSSPGLGRLARKLGLLLVPSETDTPPEVASIPTRTTPDRRWMSPKPRVTTDPRTGNGVSLPLGERVARSPQTVGRSMHNAERGLFDLRQGRPLLVTAPKTDLVEQPVESDMLVAAVEGLDLDTFDRMRALGTSTPRLVLTKHRVAAMGLVPPFVNGGGPGHYALALSEDVTLERLVALSCGSDADSLRTSSTLEVADRAEAAALSLVRLGRMLPAVVAVPITRPHRSSVLEQLSGGAILHADADEIRNFVASSGAEVVLLGEAPVPLAEAEDSRFMLFREAHGLQEHVAILAGREHDWPDPVPVRLHSACLTGDLFGSLRCDCGEQLRSSMEIFRERGGGVLLYLAQEGRGIGLRNKFRAYTLQDGGLDTIDADEALGFGPDERSYDVAARILQSIGVRRIELLTNNPEKVQAMQDAGITVVRRQPLHGTLNRHNLPYVRAKVQRAGHWLGDMLSQPLSGD